MPLSLESETTFPDVLHGMQKVLEGLSELAGLDGFDTIVEKIDAAAEECEFILTQLLRSDGCVHPTGSQ